MKLSILIATLPHRFNFLHRLLSILSPQVTKEVEVLINMDAKARTLGAKRNSLIASASGEYICFVDDDDRVSDDYVAQIMAGIAQGVDAVTIQQVITTDGKNPHNVYDRLGAKWETLPNGDYMRGVQHLDVVKREIALRFKYQDSSFGEDNQWSQDVAAAGAIKTAHAITKPVYFYEFVNQKPSPRDVWPDRLLGK